MSAPTADRADGWMTSGTQHFVAAATTVIAQLADDSLLPGWDRRTVMAHLVGNARALVNLVSWARTGEPCPMYANPHQRAADIARIAGLHPSVLLADVVATAQQLRADYAALPASARDRPVVTAAGRTVPASEVLWLRSREVNVHAVDLRAGVGFEDLMPDFLHALCDDAANREVAGRPVRVTSSDGGSWLVAGTGEPHSAAGELADVTAYLTGRPHHLRCADGSAAPVLPPWL